MIRLEARDVTVRIGSRTLLDRAGLAVAAGEMVGLIGPNGAGKSTLLTVLAGLRAPAAGAVLLEERPLSGFEARARARAIGYLEQGSMAHWPLSVRHTVALGRLPHRGPLAGEGADDRAAIQSAMRACGVLHLAEQTVTTLSGGERTRVMLARVLAGQPRMVLADEPVAGLDPAHQLQVMDLLKQRAAAGQGVIVVLHDMALALRYCHRLVCLADGAVVADGAPLDLLERGTLADIYGVDLLTGRHDGQAYALPWRLTREVAHGG